MRRFGVFAVVGLAQLALGTALLFACDLGLQPYADPDAAVFASPTATSTGSSAADSAPPSDAGDAQSDAPSDASGPPPPDNAKRIFVSSAVVTGNTGGIAGADKLCQALADGARLGGTFIAWLSTTDQPVINRIKSNGPWYLVDKKTRVFASKAAITTTFAESPIVLDETGKSTIGLVWTGTLASGAAAPPSEACVNFGVETATGMSGDTSAKGQKTWTESGVTECKAALHLYCIEP